MSGIFGLWDRGERPIDKNEIKTACRVLSHRGSPQITLGPNWVMVEFKDAPGQPKREDVRRFVVTFDGRLDEEESSHAQREPGAFIENRLSYSAGEIPRHLGDFALAVFDRELQTLSLARDPVGCRPLYYAELNHRVIFASEIKGLLPFLGNSSHPNESSLRDWFSPALSVLEDVATTPFSGVLAVPPGSRIQVTRNALTLHSHDELGTLPQQIPKNFREAVEQFEALFRSAVKRRCRNERVGVSVSGGLDSSSIYVTADREGFNPVGMALDAVGDGNESNYLELLEARLGRPICRVRVESSPRDYIQELREGVWHGEFPFVDYLGHAQAELYSRLRTEGATVCLSGHWADELMHTPAYLVDLFRGGRFRTLGRHLETLSDWFTPEETSALRRRFAMETLRSLVPTFVAAGMKPFRHLSLPRRFPSGLSKNLVHRPLRESWKLASPGPFPSHHANALYLSLRSRLHLRTREWMSKSAARFGLRAEFPFLDRNLVEFLLAISGEIKNWDGVPRALLREGMKELLPLEIARRNWKTSYSDTADKTLRANETNLRGLLRKSRTAVSLGLLSTAIVPPSERELVEVCGLEVWCASFYGEGSRLAPIALE